LSIQNIMTKAKAAVEYMYDKTATIKRYQEVTKTSGADGMDWVVIHQDVPGRLSTIGVQSLKNTSLDEVNKIEYELKFLMSNEYKVLAGDEFTIAGITYLTSREPFVYTNHQEILLVRKGYA
jgi:hypothetical protein